MADRNRNRPKRPPRHDGDKSRNDKPDLTEKEKERRQRQREREHTLEGLSGRQRRRRIERVQGNEDLSDKQQRNRIGDIRESGHVMSQDKFKKWQQEQRQKRQREHRNDAGADPTIAPKDMDAYAILVQKFKDYGLDTLAPKIKDLLMDGRSSAEIELELQETKEWKQRFAGNEQLRKQGGPVLSVSEYLETEKTYGQIMQNYGLPNGFYNDPDDFANFIGNRVSAKELEDRVGAYADLARREDPAVVEALRQRGIGQNELLAYMIDPSRAWPLLQKKYQSTLISAAGDRAGAKPTSLDYADKLAGMGVTEQEAGQKYGVIGQMLPGMSRLGDVWDEQYDKSEAEQELFENSASAAEKRQRIVGRESAAFSGASGMGQSSLRRSTAGQY